MLYFMIRKNEAIEKYYENFQNKIIEINFI